MNMLGNGLHAAKQHEDALSVREVELSMRRRVGIIATQHCVSLGNLASSYQMASRLEDAFGCGSILWSLETQRSKNRETLREANNYASTLVNSNRLKRSQVSVAESIPVARRVLGEMTFSRSD